jgi:hypothetical protein
MAQSLRRFRQGMGLAIVDHLQSMLDAAEIMIGGVEVVGDRALDAPSRDQRFESRESRRRPQFRLAAAPDELLGLDEEFDLADATTAKLDVVAANADRGAALVGIDLAFDRMNVLDRGEVEALAPQEWAQVRVEGVARRAVAADRSRLDQRRALPILAHALVIHFRGQNRDHGWRGSRIGTKPEIGAEHVAVLGAFLKECHQCMAELYEELLRALASAVTGFFIVEQEE